MYELLSGLDALSEQFTTTNRRLAVTVAAAGVLLLVLLSYRDFQEWLSARTKPLYVDIAMTALLVGTCLGTIAVTLGVWGETDQLWQLYEDPPLGEDTVAKSIFTATIILLTYIVLRFVRRLLRELLDSASAVTDHQREITHRLTQVIVWSTAIVVILGVWIDDLSGLLVGAGVLGVVIGMAARQTLGTMLAGFVLMFARPFEIGDWVEVEEDEGIVTDISIFNTRVQSFDGEYIMVPNDLVASSVVTNRSKRGRLRIEIDVGVDYATDVERASELAVEAVDGVEEAMEMPEPQAITKSFDDSAVLLGVRFWIDKPSARRRSLARTAAIGAIKRAFEEEGVKIPYPQQELSGRAETGGFRIAGAESNRDATDRDGSDDRANAAETERDSDSSDAETGGDGRREDGKADGEHHESAESDESDASERDASTEVTGPTSEDD